MKRLPADEDTEERVRSALWPLKAKNDWATTATSRRVRRGVRYELSMSRTRGFGFDLDLVAAVLAPADSCGLWQLPTVLQRGLRRLGPAETHGGPPRARTEDLREE